MDVRHVQLHLHLNFRDCYRIRNSKLLQIRVEERQLQDHTPSLRILRLDHIDAFSRYRLFDYDCQGVPRLDAVHRVYAAYIQMSQRNRADLDAR